MMTQNCVFCNVQNGFLCYLSEWKEFGTRLVIDLDLYFWRVGMKFNQE